MKKRNRNYIRTTIEVPVYHVHWYDPKTKKEEEDDLLIIPDNVAVISCEEVKRLVKHLRMPIEDFIKAAEEYTPAIRVNNK